MIQNMDEALGNAIIYKVNFECNNIFLFSSHRHFTREALPRLDNYRNIMSIQAGTRPTLEELHNASITNKVSTCNIFFFVEYL